MTGSRPPGPLHENIPSLVAATPVIAVGTVVAVAPGRAVVVGEDRLTFNDISVRIERLLKGKLDNPFVLEQVAHVEKIVSPGIGPPYRVGERYVLFLQPGEGHRFIPVIQGRYRIARGLVTPLDPGPAADSVRGLSEAQVLMQIETATGNKELR